jgi:hypothetical protein
LCAKMDFFTFSGSFGIKVLNNYGVQIFRMTESSIR